MAKIYYVATVDESGKGYAFFDGKSYSDNPDNAKLFSERELTSARVEAGDHQRYNPKENVQVLSLLIDIPVAIAPKTEIAQTPGLDTLKASVTE